ncbi:MAG: 16S rRNA (guanine(966)-N(2))-methyltransferase RsmD [Paenisporosarcina sp.]
MRVISGICKGLPIKAVPGSNTRPTTDKVKESIFNMIGPYFDGGLVIDLFAGSGSLGIEALSRGMDSCIFIEKDAKAVQIIHENLKKCKLEDQAEVFKIDASRAVKALEKREVKVDLLFLDPPYQQIELYNLAEIMVQKGLLSSDAIIMCEHEKTVDIPETIHSFSLTRRETYGSTIISIYRKLKGEGERHD